NAKISPWESLRWLVSVSLVPLLAVSGWDGLCTPLRAVGADCSLSPGIRCWDIDLASCNLDEQLKLFVSRHSATFSSIVKASLSSDMGRAEAPVGLGSNAIGTS
uniref:Microtubule-associated protein 1B/S N-terminal domain-containing protein n=1 Tax=Gopherus agassizii TaxID=38772 RepID=A0A452HTF0_9SAUR